MRFLETLCAEVSKYRVQTGSYLLFLPI